MTVLAALGTACFIAGMLIGASNSERLRSAVRTVTRSRRRHTMGVAEPQTDTAPAASAAMAFEAAARFADETGRPEHVDAYARALLSLADVPTTLRPKPAWRSKTGGLS